MHWVNQRIPPRYPPPRSPPALSVQLKEKRNAAIMELHKEGKNPLEISKVLGVSKTAVYEFVNAISGNALGAKTENTPEVSASTVPMASTEDRSETREDARSFIDASLRKMALGQISKSDQRTT